MWTGSSRQALLTAMEATVAMWDTCQVTAVRNGLLALATEGWVPVNPDLTIEYQRDCYIRRRTHPCSTFLAFLYNNLCYPAAEEGTAVEILNRQLKTDA